VRGSCFIRNSIDKLLTEVCSSSYEYFSFRAFIFYLDAFVQGLVWLSPLSSFLKLLLHHVHRFFADKVRLFHEVEYAHVVIFFLGLGLVVQGLALAIVNKELKAIWKFSTEQTLEDVS